jgi:hypothetical protein
MASYFSAAWMFSQREQMFFFVFFWNKLHAHQNKAPFYTEFIPAPA